MRILSCLILFLFVLTGCEQNNKHENKELARLNENQEEYQSFGEKISALNALSAAEMKQKFQGLTTGDTITEKFTASVSSVCKMKGCWMTLVLPDVEDPVMVKFKDYGFFMPKDIENRKVIVEGVAYIEETSVEDLRHFAQDSGKSQDEIDAITEAEKTYAFLANGVLLKE